MITQVIRFILAIIALGIAISTWFTGEGNGLVYICFGLLMLQANQIDNLRRR